MSGQEVHLEENVELADLLLDIAQPILESRKEELRGKQIKQEQKIKIIDELKAEYRKLLLTSKQRIASEKAVCDNVSSQTVPLLIEIKEFAEKHQVFPRITSGDNRISNKPDLPIKFFRRQVCDVDLPFENQIPDGEVSLRKGIEWLSNVHVRSEFGLEWSFFETESGTYSGEYGLTEHWSKKYEITHSVTVIFRFPNEILVNDKAFNYHDVGSKTFKMALAKAFYSPKCSKKTAGSSRSEERNTDFDVGLTQTKSQKVLKFIGNPRKEIRKFWQYLWDDVEVFAEDSFIKRMWYGDVDAMANKNSIEDR